MKKFMRWGWTKLFFDGEKDNTLYDNLVVNDNLKEQMLKACLDAKKQQ